MDYSENPPVEPDSLLQAVSNLAAHVEDINEVASKILINKQGLFKRVVRFFKPCKLPEVLEQLASNIQYVIDWDNAAFGLFYDNDLVPLDDWRIENTLERLLKPLIYLSYILVRGIASSPRRLNVMRMIAAIATLADVLAELGTVVRPFIRAPKYERTLHAVTRLKRAEAAWRDSLSL